MLAPVLVFAVGNESRGDDALGVLLLRELAAWIISNNVSEQFELLEDFQLQIEHAMDMKERRLVLFIDAGMDTAAPFTFYRAQSNDEPVLYSHELAQEALLKVYTQFYRETPPETFILCIRGERFELGEGLSCEAEANLASAFEFGKMLLTNPVAVAWKNMCLK